MAEPNFTVLYVTDVSASTKFYTDLLGRPPVEASPGFALFALKSGMMLGLWRRSEVQPPATGPGGSAPAKMDFGFTFLACDPDGHRLRVFAEP